jgi:hypothetical protein
MKELKIIFMQLRTGLLILSVLMFSCQEGKFFMPKSSFEGPFPKRNKNPTAVLGRQIWVKRGNDTIGIRVVSGKGYNLLLDEQGDTLFQGTASRFRSLYFLSRQLNDSSFQIHALKIKGKLIYGLQGAWVQGFLVDNQIERGIWPQLVKYVTPDSTSYKLKTDKKLLRKLFVTILQTLPPDTLINMSPEREVEEAELISTQWDSEESEYISGIYPNPVRDKLTINLRSEGRLTYRLTGVNGVLMREGKLDEEKNTLFVGDIPAGMYVLTLLNPASGDREVMKIVKAL